MPHLSWILAAVFFALAGEAEAAPPLPTAEAQWAQAAQRFDGTPAWKKDDLWLSPWSKKESRPPAPRAPGDGRPDGEFRDRKDYRLAGLGIFGAVLMAFASIAESRNLRNAGAAVLLLGFLLMSWV